MDIRPASESDLPALWPLIERCYRGDTARLGWSHEADLISGERTDLATLTAIVNDRASRLLTASRNGALIGCAHIADRSEGVTYLGLLCIEPRLQAAGLGRQLMAAAEDCARMTFGARHVVMSVIENRAELIAYYKRRGYVATGRRLDFPVRLDPPLFMAELCKRL